MRLVILGCGRVGSRLATIMSQEGHEVTVIDRERDAFDRLGPEFKGAKILGIGIDEEVLKQAGLEQADAFAAVTNGDNTNIMTAQIARERFKVPRVIARVYDPLRAEVYSDLGIETVCPTTVGVNILKGLLMEELQPSENFSSASSSAPKS